DGRLGPPASWFFFSSGRRHTRFSRDWSSDVCSSDLSSNGARLWLHDVRVYMTRPDGTLSYAGTIPHVHYSSVEPYAGGEIVSIGGVNYMPFPANYRLVPWNTAYGQLYQIQPPNRPVTTFTADNHYGTGFAIRKPI